MKLDSGGVLSNPDVPLSNAEWLEALRTKAHRNRVPISCMLELTSRCNLKCQHCYLGPQSEQHKKRSLELSTDEVKAIIDQFVEQGALNLTITGGDPMMRGDFAEIYRYAKESGLLVTVFCDAILVNAKIIELFNEYPPRKVEVSVYGATAETYETVTRVRRSFEKACRGIQRLLDNGINLELKTVLMTLNQHELRAMRDWAEDLGVKFRFDAAIFPCLPDNAKEPLDLRVKPEDAIRLEMEDPRTRDNWKKKFEASKTTPVNDRLYSCSAGGSALYVDPQGKLSPCLMTTHVRYDLKEKPLESLWNNEMRSFQEKKRTKKESAFTGPLRGLCSHCPAFNQLESGDEENDSEYGMKLARLRQKYLSDELKEDDTDDET